MPEVAKDLAWKAGGLVVAALAAWLLVRRAMAPGGVLTNGTFNPASTNNLAYRGANSVAQALTGDAGATVGTSVFEWLNPGAVERERAAIYGPVPEAPDTSAWDRLLAGEFGIGSP